MLQAPRSLFRPSVDPSVLGFLASGAASKSASDLGFGLAADQLAMRPHRAQRSECRSDGGAGFVVFVLARLRALTVLVRRSNVRAETGATAGRQAREAHDRPERIAGLVARRCASTRARG